MIITIQSDFLKLCIQEPAPEHILQIIRCNCSTTTKNPCGKLCQCRRHGIPCMTACGQCQGINCTNAINNGDDEMGDDSEFSSSDEDNGNIFDRLLDF